MEEEKCAAAIQSDDTQSPTPSLVKGVKAYEGYKPEITEQVGDFNTNFNSGYVGDPDLIDHAANIAKYKEEVAKAKEYLERGGTLEGMSVLPLRIPKELEEAIILQANRFYTWLEAGKSVGYSREELEALIRTCGADASMRLESPQKAVADIAIATTAAIYSTKLFMHGISEKETLFLGYLGAMITFGFFSFNSLRNAFLIYKRRSLMRKFDPITQDHNEIQTLIWNLITLMREKHEIEKISDDQKKKIASVIWRKREGEIAKQVKLLVDMQKLTSDDQAADPKLAT
ncbi:MAG: hypothetical protein AAB373_00625 [Patescibacteria group bacterium]